MRRIKWWLNTGFAGEGYYGDFEVADNATDDEVEAIAREHAFDKVDWGWTEEDDS